MRRLAVAALVGLAALPACGGCGEDDVPLSDDDG